MPAYEQQASPSLRNSIARRVGFYGCSRAGGTVVRLERDEPDYPQSMVIKCPACKHEHTVQPFWRRWMPGLDADKESHIV